MVISCGGGGVPVVQEKGGLKGVAAVIDKDLATEKLAELVDADVLMTLTTVEKVSLNYKKPGQRDLGFMTVSECGEFIGEGQFAPGSMLPKIQAAVKFAKSRPGRRVIITSLGKAGEAMEGRAGTLITL